MAKLLRLFFESVYIFVLFIFVIATMLLAEAISLIPGKVFTKVECYIVLFVMDILLQIASMVNSQKLIVKINSLADEFRSLLNEK